MTARVYRADDWNPVSRAAADVIAIGAERVIDDGREVMDADPRVIRDLARTVVALRGDAALPDPIAKIEARARRTIAQRDQPTCDIYIPGQDTTLSTAEDVLEVVAVLRRRDARERELAEALRTSLARWRAARGRYTPLPHCDVCGARLAADGTEAHDADCAVGRDLRVIDGGAR